MRIHDLNFKVQIRNFIAYVNLMGSKLKIYYLYIFNNFWGRNTWYERKLNL